MRRPVGWLVNKKSTREAEKYDKVVKWCIVREDPLNASSDIFFE